MKYNLFYAIVIALGFAIPSAYCQQGEDTITATEEVAGDSVTAEPADTQAVVEKIPFRLSIEAFKINDELKLLARTRSKVKAKFQNTANVEVNFYKNEVTAENLIGKIISDHKGEAVMMLKADPQPDSAIAETFYAVVKDHPDYEDAEEMISVNPSVMTMELVEEDSSKIVNVFLGQPDATGEILPIADAECILYVKRLFGLMPVVEAGVTDAEGNVQFIFPEMVPGDTAGNITVVAKIKEHEIAGNVEVGKNIAWGVAVESDDFYEQRALWSARSNSPVLLIVVVNAVILGIWGVIAFIFLEIYRINKLGRVSK